MLVARALGVLFRPFGDHTLGGSSDHGNDPGLPHSVSGRAGASGRVAGKEMMPSH